MLNIISLSTFINLRFYRKVGEMRAVRDLPRPWRPLTGGLWRSATAASSGRMGFVCSTAFNKLGSSWTRVKHIALWQRLISPWAAWIYGLSGVREEHSAAQITLGVCGLWFKCSCVTAKLLERPGCLQVLKCFKFNFVKYRPLFNNLIALNLNVWGLNFSLNLKSSSSVWF